MLNDTNFCKIFQDSYLIQHKYMTINNYCFTTQFPHLSLYYYLIVRFVPKFPFLLNTFYRFRPSQLHHYNQFTEKNQRPISHLPNQC